MEGVALLLLMALSLGFVAGYRYGTGRTSAEFRTVMDTRDRRHQYGSYGKLQPKKIDVVCKEAVSVDRAKPSVHEGNFYYFCSRECREVFEATPEMYVSERPRDEGG